MDDAALSRRNEPRMRTADKQIADILVRYGEPFGGNVWRVQGTAVISHKALERIAAKAGIKSGDVIVSVNSQPVKDARDLANRVSRGAQVVFKDE